MNCPNCEKEVSFHKLTCEACGQDLKIHRKIISASNSFYNDGLKKAKIRDLSGAVISLKKSLKLNKKNTEARNLLGLVYFEMGEVVSALSEWNISKKFQNGDNVAENYIVEIQKNAGRLETINQTVRKYNNALQQVNQGNYDLSIMQLEKAVSLNPKFIRGYQLLALLYMKQGQYKKALKHLSKAKKIDINNGLTVYYIEQLPQKPTETVFEESTDTAMVEKSVRGGKIFQPEIDIPATSFNFSTYKEERFNFFPYLNLMIGAILGIAVVYFLLVPTAKKAVAVKYEKQFTQYTNELSAQSVRMTSLENEKETLEKQLEELQEKLNDLKADGIDADTYTKFYKAIKYYMTGDEKQAAQTLSGIKETAIENKNAKEIYKAIKKETFKKVSDQLAEEGRRVYNNGKYEDAIKLLKKATTLDKDNTKAIYFLGRCYHRMGDTKKAKKYYNMIVNDYPDSDRVAEAKSRLRELQ